jgi:hypothetical protein
MFEYFDLIIYQMLLNITTLKVALCYALKIVKISIPFIRTCIIFLKNA